MACGHIGIADFLSPVHQLGEFDVPVAVDAGVGGFPMLVGGGKPVHHLAAKGFLEVEHIKGHPQPEGHAAGVGHVVHRAAGALSRKGLFRQAPVAVVRQGQGDADAVVALPLAQQGRHAGIHSAAHGDDGLLLQGGLFLRKVSHRISFFSSRALPKSPWAFSLPKVKAATGSSLPLTSFRKFSSEMVISTSRSWYS